MGAVARAALAHHLEMLQRHMGGARAGRVAAVHQLRVSTRRLRAALALFESVLPRRTSARMNEELGWLGRTIGPVRDLDVLRVDLARRSRELDPVLAPALTTVLRHAGDRRSAAHGILVDALDAPRTQRLVVQLTALAGSALPTPARVACALVAPTLVRPLVRAVRHASRGVDDSVSPDVLHRLRVRVKRLRYALEAVSDDQMGATRTLGKRLAALQELLGAQHDAVSQQAWLRTEAAEFADDPQTLLAVGALCEVLRRRARRLARRAPPAIDRALRRKLMAAALGELGRRAATRDAA